MPKKPDADDAHTDREAEQLRAALQAAEQHGHAAAQHVATLCDALEGMLTTCRNHGWDVPQFAKAREALAAARAHVG